MFRSIRFYRFRSPWPESEQALSEALAKAEFTPCAPLTEKSSGWESPTDADGPLCRRVEGADLLRLRTQSRVLPAAAVNEALEQRLADYRARTGEMPGRREKRRLKNQTRDELVTKALLKSDRTLGFCIPAQGLIGVDTVSNERAERFIDYLRTPIGRFEAEPLEYKRPVGDLLTQIFLGDIPANFALGRECRMLDPADGKATVRFTDMELADARVRKHVRDGMRLTQLGIEYDSTISCVLDEQGQMRKLKFLDIAENDIAGEVSDEDPLAELDARFVLTTRVLRALVEDLGKLLGKPA